MANLKTLNYIKGFEDWEYEALLDSCGHSLKELKIYRLDYIPSALARENLALTSLDMDSYTPLSAEEIIRFC